MKRLEYHFANKNKSISVLFHSLMLCFLILSIYSLFPHKESLSLCRNPLLQIILATSDKSIY